MAASQRGGRRIVLDCRADAGSANPRVEGVANPNNHFRFRGQWQNSGVQNFCSGGGQRVRLVVGKFVEQLGLVTMKPEP